MSKRRFVKILVSTKTLRCPEDNRKPEFIVKKTLYNVYYVYELCDKMSSGTSSKRLKDFNLKLPVIFWNILLLQDSKKPASEVHRKFLRCSKNVKCSCIH